MTNTTITARPEQLTLLPAAEVPLQFRLDEVTRRRGLAHIAELRAQLDEARERRTIGSGRRRSDRTPLISVSPAKAA